jgi:hypothetical protein
MARASDRGRPAAAVDRPLDGAAILGPGIDRRGFRLGALGAAAAWGWAGAGRAAEPAGASLPDATRRLLETSPFVYVSPLRADGEESTCHGEVWFAWLDGSVVVNTRRGTWKAKALERGLDRARLWVGDYGRWKGRFGGKPDESFRQGPSFDARARFETDRAVLDRLIAAYEKKYPKEFGRWREDMQAGFYSGERRLIRYQPL